VEWTRRNLFPLALLAAVPVAAGCSSPGPGDADGGIRQRAAARAAALAAMYGRAASAGSADPRFVVFRGHHLAHRALLLSGAANPATADPVIPAAELTAGPASDPVGAQGAAEQPPSQQPSAAASPTASSLSAAESAASTAAEPDLTAASGALAGLLADIDACRAVHCAALETGTAQTQTAAAAPDLAMSTQADLTAAQTILGAEHAAVYAYGALTPHLTGAQRDQAHGLYELHRQLRDDLETDIAAHGATPAAMVSAYAFPEQPTDPANAVALASYVETRVAAVCANAVTMATGTGRAYAAWAVVNASLRAYSWGRAPAAFPATFSA
jgi:Domain of unknown function (DUF4439)